MPKQFLPLLGKPIFLRSLDVFQSMPEVCRYLLLFLLFTMFLSLVPVLFERVPVDMR
jgi:2-C-methyl-D-erythritol 4-phosphate cytidylyltransferase